MNKSCHVVYCTVDILFMQVCKYIFIFAQLSKYLYLLNYVNSRDFFVNTIIILFNQSTCTDKRGNLWELSQKYTNQF